MKVRNLFTPKNKLKLLASFFFLFDIFYFSSCATDSSVTEKSGSGISDSHLRNASEKFYDQTHFSDGTEIVTSDAPFKNRDTILLTFAGDLMAHVPVWKNGEYERIYKDISPILKKSDFAFTNLETPVCDSRPYSGYPGFNVHHEYVDTAIDAGFNVFSLTNNHTNDQGLTGINATREYFKTVSLERAKTDRPVYYAGLKEEKRAPLTYQVIEKNGWKILYIAVTELLNNTSNSDYIDYIPPIKKQRELFIQTIQDLQKENPSDLFIISIHCSDPEYIFDIRSSQENWYRQLLDNGATVIWVNHPHIAKDWELIPDENNEARKMIFHSMGNLISCHESRRNTGEGFMTQVVFEKTLNDGIRIVEINPILLTTYRTHDNHYVIKKLNTEFIDLLEAEDPSQVNFFRERLHFMKKISGKVKWQ